MPVAALSHGPSPGCGAAGAAAPCPMWAARLAEPLEPWGWGPGPWVAGGGKEGSEAQRGYGGPQRLGAEGTGGEARLCWVFRI